jgi:ribose transport system permease protein
MVARLDVETGSRRALATSEVTEIQDPTPNKGTELARRVISRYAIVIALLLSIAFFSILKPSTFFTTGNLTAILSSQAVMLIVALALTLPLIAGDFDLSIGYMLGFTMALVTVLTVKHHWAWPLAVLACIAAGVVVGVVNGVVIVHLKVNAFIVTLGTGTVLLGLTQMVTNGETLSGVPQPIQTFSGHLVFGVPLVAYYAFALALVLWYVYEHTPLGRYLLFVGGGRDAARLAGIPVRRLRLGAFVGASAICGIAGVLLAGQIGAEDPSIGATYLLPAYAAAFLGATTIKPGRFNALGTVVALFLLATGITGLQLLGAPFWVEPLFNGVVLTVAVTFASLASRAPRME